MTALGRVETDRHPQPVITRHSIREDRRTLRVLLAEDNPVNRKLVVAMLHRWGHEVVAVPDGSSAIDRAKQEPFDLVLMDVQMPRMDGLTAARGIREHEKKAGHHVPIIALTAHAMKGDREQCLEAGMNSYIPKPIRRDDLYEAIERIISERDKAMAHRSSIARFDGQPDGAGESVIDSEEVLNRVGGDVDLLRDVVATFRKQTPGLLDEMGKQIAANDTDGLRGAAHMMKGCVANFTSRNAYESARSLEIMGREKNLASAREELNNLERQTARLIHALDAFVEKLE
jgi:CheY-like chemotaxis protein/HPt (histidine-containing phosphotransfer) domain-containing protein